MMLFYLWLLLKTVQFLFDPFSMVLEGKLVPSIGNCLRLHPETILREFEVYSNTQHTKMEGDGFEVKTVQNDQFPELMIEMLVKA
jgi:hypothetical protein